MKVLEIFTQEFSNNDLGLTLVCYGKVIFALWVLWKDIMDFVEDFINMINDVSPRTFFVWH